MTIPLLNYAPSSQNQRVPNYEVPGDEQSWTYCTENLLSESEIQALIWAAYRQIFNEQQLLSSNRDKALESQLRGEQITVREFIRGLLLSDSFRQRNYEPNSNYRFVEMCVQRVLGRNIYSDREKMAWSITIATKGLEAFVDQLLNSDEYLENFGDDTVPYQRRRILPQRKTGELPFARMPRYGADYRSKLEDMGYFSHDNRDWQDSAKRTRNLRRIQDSVKNMVQLLDDILTINRAETGKLEFNPKPMDLIRFCRQLVEEIQLSTDANHKIFCTKHYSISKENLILSDRISFRYKRVAHGVVK